MSSRSVSKKVLSVLPLLKEVSGMGLRINTLIFKPWKVLRNRLLLKLVLLCQVDIQESPREGNTKFNFLGIILVELKVIESAFFKLPKTLKFEILAIAADMLRVTLGLLQTSRFRYPEVGTYVTLNKQQLLYLLFRIFFE